MEGRLVSEIRTNEYIINPIINVDTNTVLTFSHYGSIITLWDIRNAAKIRETELDFYSFYDATLIRYSNGNLCIVVSGLFIENTNFGQKQIHKIAFINFDTFKVIRSDEDEIRSLEHLYYNESNKSIIGYKSGGNFASLSIFCSKNLSFKENLKTNYLNGRNIIFSTIDNIEVIIGSYANQIRILNLETLELIREIKLKDIDDGLYQIWKIAIHPIQNTLAIFFISKEEIWIWNIENNKCIKKLEFPKVEHFCFSFNGNFLLVAVESELLIFETKKYNLIENLVQPIKEASIGAIATSIDENYFLIGAIGYDGYRNFGYMQMWE